MAVAANALCALADLKAYAGLPSAAAAYDAALEALIDAVSEAAEQHTGRVLAETDYTWRLDGNGLDELLVPEWPLNSVTTLTVNGETIPARASLTSSGYVPTAYNIKLVGYLFYEGIQNVSIAAKAGYSTVPADLKQAAIEWAAWKLKESSVATVGKGELGMTSVVLPAGGGTKSYWTSQGGGVPPQVKAVLDQYRRLA